MTRRFAGRLAALSLLLVLAVWALPALAEEGEPLAPPEDEPATEEAADPAGFLDIVFALSAEFADYGLAPDEVQALHDAGVGLGDIFKLQLIAAAWPEESGPITIADLLILLTNEEGELELGFGKWKHGLSPEQLALLEGLPRNLGQVVAAAHRSGNAGGGRGHADEGNHGNEHGNGGNGG